MSGSKSLSMNEVRKRCGAFAADWRTSAGDERQEAQSFIRDLLSCFGITKTKAALYEKRARRSSTGNQGYIDALLPGLCLIEMKSAGKDLQEAERQALDYIDALPDPETPRWVITCDFRTFRVLDLEAPEGTDTAVFALDDLTKNAHRLAFLAGYQTRAFGSREQEQASIKAAKIMAQLFEAISDSGYDDHQASVFLVRLLFCLYADDAGVWDRDSFFEFIETRTSEDGSDLGPQIALLFQVMNQPEDKRPKRLDEMIARFDYVNGGLFAESVPIPSFDQSMRKLLLDACAFNWSSISPAIFGSMFQAVKSADARRELGEHYTTETNILKTIEPLFLDGLRERFAASLYSVRDLKKLRQEIGQLRVLDPACGCGNFLVIAYRELRRLDLDILLRLQELGDDNEMPTIFFTRENLNVSLDHFAGIELEEWPAQITATALHLADHQANQAMELALGQAPQPLPLDKVNNIHVGNALHMNWASIFDPIRHPVMLLGNPPFVGMAYMTADQQADNRHVFAEITTPGLRTGRLDYVACWYAKALPYLANAPFSRAAFVSTNSITQGEQARTMDPLLAQFGCEVDFAHQTFKWTSEAPDAAKVHCVVVGFSRINTTGGQQAKKRRRLYTYKTVTSAPDESIPKRLNFRLEDADTFVPRKLAAPLVAGMPMAHKGSQPTDGKFLIIKESELPELREDQHAAPYLRRYVQGKDMLNDTPRRWCLWLKDADPRDMRASSLLQRRLAGVAEARAKSPTASVRAFADKPALFTQDRQPSTRYFALPEVSSITRRWIPGRYFEPDIVAGNKLIIFPGAQDWHVALLQSSMFATWARQFGGKLKSDYSISPALTYFPIPFPTTTESQRADLEDAIRTVFDVRASFPDASLADLYSPTAMPPSLVDAHLALDSVVDRAFGAKKTLQNNEARAALLQSRYYALTANS